MSGEKTNQDQKSKSRSNARTECGNMNIKEFMRFAIDRLKAVDIETPVLEAGVVLCHVLKCDRTYLYSHDDRMLQKGEIEALNYMLRQRVDGVPLQYLLGKTEFMSLPFIVGPAVLIPRQDTELLVEKCIELVNGISSSRTKRASNVKAEDNTDLDTNKDNDVDIDKNVAQNSINSRDEIGMCAEADKSKVKVLDMCTGSGCVAISIATYCPDSTVVACDISRDALRIAKVNSERNGVQNRLELHYGDLFEALAGERGFDIIVSNPPYIETSIMPSLQKEVRNHEPHLALDGGLDGLNFYRKITAMAPSYLNDGGYLAFEIGYNQGQSVKGLMQKCFKDAEIFKDIGGNDRVVIGKLSNKYK
jgi:release factor glutamine methyltransferase